MPKLTETFARKVPQTKSGTDKHWDSEVKGLVLFVGKRSKTWYFQKGASGQTQRVLIGRFPVISADVARQTAMGFALEWRNIHEDHIHLQMTKNGRSFDLPILQLHHEVLAPVRGLSRQWVFPSSKSLAGHITGPEKITWSPHAHRRTFATVAMEAGVLEEVVGRLLNHTPLSITGQRYVKPSLDALRPAMAVVCNELASRVESA